MDGHDRPRAPADGRANGARIDQSVAIIQVDRHGNRAREMHRLGRGYEGVARHDDLVARSDA